ncbi:MAG: hypothetical protein ACXABY_03760 [Candidatus Thorarchaeota archaeon]|jgi:hypothetical protein
MSRLVHDIEEALNAVQAFYDARVEDLEDEVRGLKSQIIDLEGEVSDLERECYANSDLDN